MTAPGTLSTAVRFLDPVSPVLLFDATARLLHALRPREQIEHSRFPDHGGTYQWWAPVGESVSANGVWSWGFSVIAGMERNLAEYDEMCRPDGDWPGQAWLEVSIRLDDPLDDGTSRRVWGGATATFVKKVIARWAWLRDVRTLVEPSCQGAQWFDYADQWDGAWVSDAGKYLLRAMNDPDRPLPLVPIR